jgi:hypothetical protein
MADPTVLLRPDDPAWDAWLDHAPHDFYHRAAYHAFAEEAGEGRACLVVHGTPGQFLAWPYLVSVIDGVRVDATSVYGYPGPTGIGLEDAGFRARAWAAMRSVWAEQKLVTLFTRFHPILQNDRHCADFAGALPTPGGAVPTLGRSVSIDLAPDHDARRAGYAQDLRAEFRKAERAGLVVELDPEWRYYPRFRDFYRATMERNDASKRYMFSDAYFDGLRRALGDMGHLAVAHVDGDAAAILIFAVHGDLAGVHLAGVNPGSPIASPLKPLFDGTADLARSLGATSLHIGAGRGGHEDSLFAFKARFSPIRHDFKLGRWILDAPAYEALTRSRHGDDLPDAGFFPAYRAPALAGAAAS